ncbi:uncharacterized protein LOC116292473 [Actinia tenebrosa]|uniref:Uncharacterized protein LOC116292473 n=1 Tax=Actinia tenebrosa TaxID=6105 RepID=A0A6P8HSL1_ACTTE|nr:uncharacterized protein LOC116292473 [Actinia tenebrosa]
MDGTVLGLIIASVIVAILSVFIFWWCCIKKKEKEVILVKRCDQSSTYEIENHIISKLKSRVRFLEKSWNRGLDDRDQPVIVFCTISSRIGTDIENAMRGVHGTSPVILVLLHSVLSNLLGDRDLSGDEELLDSTMLKRMTCIAHFAFSVGEGLYDCRQNEKGHQKLASRVKKLSRNSVQPLNKS